MEALCKASHDGAIGTLKALCKVSNDGAIGTPKAPSKVSHGSAIVTLEALCTTSHGVALICSCRSLVRSKLDYSCIVYVYYILKTCSTETRPYPSPSFAKCSRRFSYSSCSRSVFESTRDVCEQQTQETVNELCFKTKNFS